MGIKTMKREKNEIRNPLTLALNLNRNESNEKFLSDSGVV